jgi:hypothetical protein
VNLGRAGALTIATFRSVETPGAPAYVVDVLALGADRVFHKELPSLRGVLENSSVTKVTFDCRGDSDALLHQFDVTIRGVLELQVLDQAVRIQRGEAPPKRCPYIQRPYVPYLQSTNAVSRRYPSKELDAPHAKDPGVWGERPLSAQAVAYAANDAHVIRELLHAMRATQLSETLAQAVKEHSARYEDQFRSRSDDSPSRPLDKEFVIEEHPIVDASDLPPRPYKETLGGARNKAVAKWEFAEWHLKRADTDTQAVFQVVMCIRQHDEWYTELGQSKILALAEAYGFSAKQLARIRNPPSLGGDDDRYDYDCDGYSS